MRELTDQERRRLRALRERRRQGVELSDRQSRALNHLDDLESVRATDGGCATCPEPIGASQPWIQYQANRGRVQRPRRQRRRPRSVRSRQTISVPIIGEVDQDFALVLGFVGLLVLVGGPSSSGDGSGNDMVDSSSAAADLDPAGFDDRSEFMSACLSSEQHAGDMAACSRIWREAV